LKRARFIAAARAEFHAELVYYTNVEPGLGRRFNEAVQEAIRRTLTFPNAGSPSPANTRRILVNGFPFCVYYRPESDGIVIFAVAHTARQPGYWESRTDDQ